ncbi:MAG: hypothetical protein R3F17_11775 [Planctomycetota bacterium]
MNTASQEIHCVSEMITGVDIIVAEQRIAAAGERLGAPRGPEDRRARHRGAPQRRRSEQGFPPHPGPAHPLRDSARPGPRHGAPRYAPTGGRHDQSLLRFAARCVIAYGKNRAEAIETLVRTLRASTIEGVSSTADLHLAVLQSPPFQSGDYDTSAIPGYSPRPA